jgi:hypothetical protein
MPSPVVELLAGLDTALQSLGIRWYLFGAQAAIVHGAARLTADVDAMKVLAGRDKDLDDVSAIATAQGPALDLEVIRKTLRDLEIALDRSDLIPLLERVLSRGGKSID